MRPSKLELAGFGSFREPTTFDFDGIDYFALVGPTGNGKSTVIDAMCFALYGKVARHDDRSVVSNIVSLGAIETRVRFTFSAGGNEYVAVRAIKVRKGSPKHDARLERADGEVLAASVRDFSAAIEQLLGLSFDDFTRCVALPQGEFQRFLHEEPAKRRSVLVRLLNLTHYERMGQRAREDASELNTRRSVLTEQRDKLTPVSDADALAAHRLVVDLQELQSRLDTDGPIDVSITEMIGGLNRAITTAQSSAEALVRIDIPQAAATLATEDAQARAQLVIAQTALASSTAQVVAIENGITAIGDVAAVERGLALWKQHHELAASLSVKQLASDTIDADLVAAQLAATNSQAVLVTVTDELERVRNENRAHALRSELHDGDSCPVCAQTITNLPEVDEPPEFSAASARAKAAKEHADAAERLRSRVLADQQQSHGAQTTMREQFARIEAQVRATSSAEALGEQQSEYQELQRALTSVREHLQVSARAERAAAQAVEASSKQSQEFQRAFDQQRDAVGHLKPPERDADDLVGSWATLRAWASEQHSAITTQVANLHVQLSQQRLSQESLRSAIIGQSTALNVAVRDFEQLPAALATALTTAEHAVAEQHRQRDAARDQIGRAHV